MAERRSLIRFPNLENTLRFLVDADLEIGTVLDVGVHTGSAPLMAVFAQKKHVLFEPVSECYERLEENYAEIDHELVKAAVSDFDGTGILHKYKIDDGEEILSQLVNEKTNSNEIDCIPSLRLDSYLEEHRESKPYLLRIATDGHEMPVLRGAQAVLEDAALLVIDAGPGSIADHINYLKPKGFQLFDIADATYYYGTLHRFDLVFVRESLAQRLEPPLSPVVWEEWVCVSYFDPNATESGAELAAAQEEIARLTVERDRLAGEANVWFDAMIVSEAEHIARCRPSLWRRRSRRLGRILGIGTAAGSAAAQARRAAAEAQWAQAARLWLDALRSDPDDGAAWIGFAQALEAAGKGPAADAAYRRAAELNAR